MMMTKAGFSGFIGKVPFMMMSGEYRCAGFDLTFGDNQRLERLLQNHYQIAVVRVNSILLNLDQIEDKSKVVDAYVKAIGNGSDLIVCRGEVRDAHQLSRLRIGLQKGSLEHFIFEYLFFTNGIKRETEYKWMPRNAYAENLADGEIDAAVFCDPDLTQILKNSRFQLFAGDMQDVALTAVGVIAVRKEFLSSKQDDVAQFISILRNGIEAVSASDDETLKRESQSFLKLSRNLKILCVLASLLLHQKKTADCFQPTERKASLLDGQSG
jgi:ABC-type nitrate/sulfonate/bicarbonate transport system substrate-binding protein